MQPDIFSIALMAVFVSFLGFVLENIWIVFRFGYADNRNMSLPFLIGYGALIIGFYEIIGIPDTLSLSFCSKLMNNKTARKIVYYLLAFILVCLGEIILGTVTEKLFGFCYWNYESLPMHITKYTSVPTSTGFALIITVFMDKYFSPIMNIIQDIPRNIAAPAAIVLISLLVLDCAVSFYLMHKHNAQNKKWEIHFKFPERLRNRHHRYISK